MSIAQYFATDLGLVEFSSNLSDAAGYPLMNLTTYDPRLEWRAASASTVQLNMDFGTARGRNFAVIHNHNLNSMDIASLQASTDAAFTSPVTVVNNIKTTDNPAVFEFSSASYRYWRLNCIPIAEALRVGQVFIDSKFQPPLDIVFPHSIGDSGYETNVVISLGGFARASQNFGAKRVIEIRYQAMPDIFRTNWRAFFERIRGRLRPFYFSDPVDDKIYFVRMDDDLNQVTTRRYGQHHIQGITMTEVYPEAT